MPLGSFPCGAGPCGFDPSLTTPRVVPVFPKALFIDLTIDTVPLDANGNALGMDPIDQEVTISLGFRKGTLPSSPDAGLDVDAILAAPLASVPTVANDQVLLAISGPIGRGDVTVKTVSATRSANRLFLQVDYVNNRTASPQTIRASTP